MVLLDRVRPELQQYPALPADHEHQDHQVYQVTRAGLVFPADRENLAHHAALVAHRVLQDNHKTTQQHYANAEF